MEVPTVNVVSTPVTHHLVAGRGKSFGGVVGFGLWMFSWGLWAYLWAVVAATAITFVRSGYDVVDTMEQSIRLTIYPFISVPMHLFVVWPYEYIWCPLHYHWKTLHIKWIKEGAHTLDQKSLKDQKSMYDSWAKSHVQQNAKYTKELEAAWKAETGSTWYPLYGGVWVLSDPQQVKEHDEEVAFAYQFGYDIAAPVYDAKHGYKPPKYCKLPDYQTGETEPIRKGCEDPSFSIFSWSHWFCNEPKSKNCTVKCSS